MISNHNSLRRVEYDSDTTLYAGLIDPDSRGVPVPALMNDFVAIELGRAGAILGPVDDDVAAQLVAEARTAGTESIAAVRLRYRVAVERIYTLIEQLEDAENRPCLDCTIELLNEVIGILEANPSPLLVG